MNNNEINIPVRSLQTFLRKISEVYTNIPSLIPDGIFGDDTHNAVIEFKKAFNLPADGIVDFECWNKILSVYDDIINDQLPPAPADIFPSNPAIIKESDTHPSLYVIHAMLHNLSSYFPNLPNISITGTHDDDSIAITKELQKIFDMEPTGYINTTFWNRLTSLYSMFISNPGKQK